MKLLVGYIGFFGLLDGLLFHILEEKKKKRKENQKKNNQTVNYIVLICLLFKIITLTKTM